MNEGHTAHEWQLIKDAIAKERERCARLVCADCLLGNKPDIDGLHVIERFEGHPMHTRQCQAVAIRNGAMTLTSPEQT